MSETQNTEAPFTWENRHSSMNIEVVWFLGQTPFKLYSGITYVVLNLCTWFPLKPFLQIYRNQDYLITFQCCIFFKLYMKMLLLMFAVICFCMIATLEVVLGKWLAQLSNLC